MRKYYLNRAETKAYSMDGPIGDPFGGPAYGEKTGLSAALVMGGASLLGGAMQASAASDAAQTQANAAKNAAKQQREMFNIQNAQQAAGRGAGYEGFNTIRSMLPGQYTTYDETGKPTGTATGTDYLTHQFNPEDFRNQMDPGYEWRLKQGEEATKRMQNQIGGLFGGNAFAGLQDYTQGLASTEYDKAFNRYQTQRGNIYNTLASIAGLGQTSQKQANELASNYVNAQTGLTTGIGAAQAAGQVGMANAISGGLQGLGSSYALSQMLAKPSTYDQAASLNNWANSQRGYGAADYTGP